MLLTVVWVLALPDSILAVCEDLIEKSLIVLVQFLELDGSDVLASLVFECVHHFAHERQGSVLRSLLLLIGASFLFLELLDLSQGILEQYLDLFELRL